MLFYIINPANDASFAKFMGYVRAAYWPEDRYMDMDGRLRGFATIPDEHDRIVALNSELPEIVKEVSAESLYTRTDDRDATTLPGHELQLPFMNQFHTLFLQRKRENQYGTAPNLIDSRYVFSLRPDPGNPAVNFSRQEGNYNHFANVVAATARLICYFHNPKSVEPLLQTDRRPSSTLERDADVLSYPEDPDIRTFKLMLAAFYHDIGKTVVDHRHGMEGAAFFSAHTTRALSQIAAIAARYFKHTWEREDLLEIADLLSYHDSFGMFGTGESSYTILPEVLDRFKRNSLRRSGDRNQQIEYSRAMLFDLWVLNIADIVASRSRPGHSKWKPQDCWSTRDDSFAEIREFLASDEGMDRTHDFGVAWRLLGQHNRSTHRDDTSDLAQLAQWESKAHTIERIKRLVCASLCTGWAQYLEEEPGRSVARAKRRVEAEAQESGETLSPEEKQERAKALADKEWPPPVQTKVFNCIVGVCGGAHCSGPKVAVGPGVVQGVIFRSIHSLSDPGEFYKRFSWIVSMDYALGFFVKIGTKAIEAVDSELREYEPGPPTGWIHVERHHHFTELPSDELCKVNANFFLDNYCATVMRILAHLLFRERSIDQFSNIEFEDARNRLNDEKVDRIMGIEGPARQDMSIESILKTVFVY